MRAESSDGSNNFSIKKKKFKKKAFNLPKVNFAYKLFLVLTRIIFKKVNLHLELIYMLTILYHAFILKDRCISLCRFL